MMVGTVFPSLADSVGMSRHVLVAMGRTEASEHTLEHVMREYPNAKISVIHVIVESDPLELFGSHNPSEYMSLEHDFELDELIPTMDLVAREQWKGAKRVFERVYDLSDAYGREVEPIVKSGEAVEEIVAYAEEQTVDRIIITEHPPTELRPLLRSVPESVARSTSIPVTIH